jgi:hypothetical protein
MKNYVLTVMTIWSFSFLQAKTRLPAIERVQKKITHALENSKSLSAQDFIRSFKNSSVKSETQVDELMTGLYWSNQRDLIGVLGQLKKDDAHKALAHLTNKICERYADAQYPLFSFIEEVKNEESALSSVATSLSHNPQNLFTSGSKREELKRNIDKHALLSHLLQELLNIVHDLLFHRT